jgi:predicted ATPase
MITRIAVNGFKSLEKFELDLQQGLNILVGPNGSGKTNIVLFFEFLSHLAKTGVSEAISRVGGAGAVFRRMSGGTLERDITVSLHGCRRFDQQRYCCYVYSFDIVFSDKVEAVFFRSQTVRIRITDRFVKELEPLTDDGAWKINVAVKVDDSLTPQAFVEGSASAFEEVLRYSYHDMGVSRKPSRWKHRIEQHIVAANPAQLALPAILFGSFARAIMEDMIGGESYNIIPSRVKEPEDCAKAPGVEKDGAGLAATLYAIDRRGTALMSPRWGFFPGYYPGRVAESDVSMDKLLSYVRLANQAIAKIAVNNDAYSNQLKVTLWIETGSYTASLPLSSMSDGTIKWLAMITAILTAPSVFSIEEPENYLHPLMQGQILKIMREVLHHRRQSFALVTTHSETILNSSRPEELVVISFGEGRTRARRCTNASQLRKEIAKTGFGLGYYYLAGAVEDE